MSPDGSRLPSFVIIGAMKSGTTSLAAYLNAHPDAFCAIEPHFFDAAFDRGIDWYREQFRDAGGVAAVGEKSPSYMYLPGVMERITGTLPDAKLVAILRHPVDRAYSHYWHQRRAGKEKLPFARALAAEPDRLAAQTKGTSPFAYVDRGMYLSQLERVAALTSSENVLVLLFEDLRSEPEKTFATLCTFLGIDPSVVPPLVGERTNTFRTYRPRWLWVAMHRYRLWRRLPRPVAERMGRVMTRESVYEPMDPAVRAQLLERFAEPNAALAAWLGRDLSVWSS
jgi:hypothetical protein